MKKSCVDLKLAKELKNNGFPQNTYFYHCPGEVSIGYEGENELYDDDTWSFVDFDPTSEYIDWFSDDYDFKSDKGWADYKMREKYLKSISCSAPTSDELLKELPVEVNGFNFRIERTKTDFIVAYFELGYEDEVRLGYYYDKELSNALAKMWLHLKKKGYIK